LLFFVAVCDRHGHMNFQLPEKRILILYARQGCEIFQCPNKKKCSGQMQFPIYIRGPRYLCGGTT
jgi:hypothetical protein